MQYGKKYYWHQGESQKGYPRGRNAVITQPLAKAPFYCNQRHKNVSKAPGQIVLFQVEFKLMNVFLFFLLNANYACLKKMQQIWEFTVKSFGKNLAVILGWRFQAFSQFVTHNIYIVVLQVFWYMIFSACKQHHLPINVILMEEFSFFLY